MNNLAKRLLAVLLISALLVSMLSGCSTKRADKQVASVIEAAQEVTSNSIFDEDNEAAQKLSSKEPQVAAALNISYDWQDYVGDLDAFVYGLLVSEYELYYEVFNAAIELADGTWVYGIGYTDYSLYYEDEEGTGYFPAGFISIIGEPDIPEEEIEAGLVIYDIENEVEGYHFVYAYDNEPFMEHCVIWGQYLQYGVDTTGAVIYTAHDYQRGECDETLGALYSYDEKCFVFDPDVGNYTPITGATLYHNIDYDAIEKEVNRILEEQDFNFSQVDLDTAIHIAQEAVNSYLLSNQTETFMGCTVEELIAAANELDPSEFIRLTANGSVVIDITEEPGEGPNEVTKWLVGISCGIVIAGSIALDLFVPALRPVSGAMSGAAVEVFMQVVIENQSLKNVKWSKVAVAAVSGALLAWACPLAAAGAAKSVVNAAGKEVVTICGKEIATEALAKITGNAVLAFSNAMVSGVTSAAYSIIDGQSEDAVFDAFLMGAAIAGASTVVCTAVGSIAQKAMHSFAETHANSWLVKGVKSAGIFIDEHQLHPFNEKIEDVLSPKSVYEATRCAMNDLRKQIAVDDFIADAIVQLPADNNPNFVKLDTDGNVITKSQLCENGGNCIIKPGEDCDPELLKMFEQYGVTEIKVTDGVPDLSPFAEYTFEPKAGISNNREHNMAEYYKQLANDWMEPDAVIPEKIKEVFTDDQLQNLVAKDVEKALSQVHLTPHEGADGYVYLIDTYFHKKLSHSGGVAWAAVTAAIKVVTTNFDVLSSSVAAAVSGTMIAEGVS